MCDGKDPEETSDYTKIGLKAYMAAIYGDHENLDKLLDELDVSLYADELTGMMPIHAAAAWGIQNVLVRHGCDINQVDSLNCSPVHHAARNGHSATVDWLIRNGANLLEFNLFGQRPSDLALANHFPELADIIRREAKKQFRGLESKTVKTTASIESKGEHGGK
uniref:ANK_REP_REGION domain-containing protein n=1 Tax=Trichobilharzia regenti TaxID=157069 RepID=A0AA85J495_TRIRE|nr:unnamed protein product [Trichobilharzia regenti]